MKTLCAAVLLLLTMPLVPGVTSPPGAADRDDSAAETLGWRLALQCWTFNNLTTFEVIDRARQMGVRYLEIYPGQKMRPGSDAKTRHDMSKADRRRLIEKLEKARIKVVNYGVVGLSGRVEADRKVFAFAKALGIETINAEPPPEALDAVEKLADEYGINVALHNHPKPSRYWNPRTAYAAVRNRGRRMGICADVGHWMRSSVDPVEALRTCADRVITFHFKDLSAFGDPGAHDVPWGTGVGKSENILALLKEKKFKGTISIEYEHRPKDQAEQVSQCVASFDMMARRLTTRN